MLPGIPQLQDDPGCKPDHSPSLQPCTLQCLPVSEKLPRATLQAGSHWWLMIDEVPAQYHSHTQYLGLLFTPCCCWNTALSPVSSYYVGSSCSHYGTSSSARFAGSMGSFLLYQNQLHQGQNDLLKALTPAFVPRGVTATESQAGARRRHD